MDLSRNLAGLVLEHPVMNAAGTCKTLHDLQRLAASAAAAVVVGSVTMRPREGNSGEVYWCDGDRYSVNSLGMPNPGADYYRETLPAMTRLVHDRGKPLIISAAGFSPEEYGELAAMAAAGGADAVELNFGCPNVWDGGRQKRIVSFDPALIAEILETVNDRVPMRYPVLVKLSPYSDPQALAEAAAAVDRSPIAVGITAVNTFANAYAVDARSQPRISAADGLAGYAGRCYKPIALGQVRQLRRRLEGKALIGVGGIWTGWDVRDFLAAGADAVQVGTAYLERDAQIFSDILVQLVDLIDE